MKNSALLRSIITLGTLVISACAQQPVPSITPALITNVPDPLTVTTAIPVESEPLSQITPAPFTDTSVEPSANGQKVITLADKGRTITLAPGERFLLKLGEAYTWDISLSEQGFINRVKEIAITPELQGVYEALKAGTVILAATGDPLCRQSRPACGRPTILFEITIVVK
jgi:hypothetical protein